MYLNLDLLYNIYPYILYYYNHIENGNDKVDTICYHPITNKLIVHIDYGFCTTFEHLFL